MPDFKGLMNRAGLFLILNHQRRQHQKCDFGQSCFPCGQCSNSTLMRSKLTSLRARSATDSTAFTQISAICSFKRPTLRSTEVAFKS